MFICLVVSTYPSQKWWSEFVSWDHEIPNWMESQNPVMFQTTKQLWMCLDVNWDVYAYGRLKIKLVKGDQPSLFEPWWRIGSRFVLIQLSVQVPKMEGLHGIKTNFGSTYIYIYIYTYTHILYIWRYVYTHCIYPVTYTLHMVGTSKLGTSNVLWWNMGGMTEMGVYISEKNAYHVIPTFLCV